MEIQYAALKLFEMASPGAADANRVSFSAGGGVVLESLKVSRSSRDKNWEPGECPAFDPEKALRLSGAPLIHDPKLPVNWLSVMLDGVYKAGAYITLSPGCSEGIPAPVAVKENAAPRRGTK